MKFHIAEVSPGRIRIAIDGDRDRERLAAFVREAASIPHVRAVYTRLDKATMTLVVDPKAPQAQLTRRIEESIRAHGDSPEQEQRPPNPGALPAILEWRARGIETQIARLQQELREVTRKRDRLRAVVAAYERALAAERRAAEMCEGES